MRKSTARAHGRVAVVLLAFAAVVLPAGVASAVQPGLTGSLLAGSLFAGGIFTTAGGRAASSVAGWDGADWSQLAGPEGEGAGVTVHAMTVYDGKLIVGGDFMQAGGEPVSGIASWDGRSWSALTGASNSPGVTVAPIGFVSSLAVYGGDLYVGGSFPRAGGTVTVNNLARWDGTEWSAVTGPSGAGTLLNGSDIAPVWDLAVHDGALVVGGNFTSVGGLPANGVAQWNGTNWSAVGMPALTDLAVMAVTDFDGELVASRSYTEDNFSRNDVSLLSGGRWTALTGPSGSGLTGNVRDLTVFDGDLVAGGSFSRAGGAAAKNIARWNGTTWSALPSLAGYGTDGIVHALAVHRGQLVAGGSFNTAGGITVNNIAQWNGSAWSAMPAAAGVGVDATVYGLLSA